MAVDDDLILAGLLCARLCHDLAGPVGAVGTGAELVAEEAESGALGNDALELLQSSAVAAGARLRFFRLAFGGASAPMPAADLYRVVADFLAPVPGGDVIVLDWQDKESVSWNPVAARLTATLILLARDCLPRGGTIRVDARATPDGAAWITAEGRIIPGETLSSLTAASPAGLGARGVAAYLAARLAALLDLVVEVEQAPTKIVLGLAGTS